MFTGIVQSKCQIQQVIKQPGLLTIAIVLPENLRHGVNLGASIAIDGVCLTVTSYNQNTGLVTFDIMQQTLDLTSLHQLTESKWVNIERSAKMNDEIGGHCVSGHIDNTAEVVLLKESANNLNIYYRYPEHLDKYLFKKGFVALHGCSLTIADISHKSHELMVSYIPETLKVTTHGEKQKGDIVNLEVDRQTQAIVDTVERVLAQRAEAGLAS